MTEPEARAAAAVYRTAADAAQQVGAEAAAAARDVLLDVQSAESRAQAEHVHAARVSAARGLVVVRRRTGKPIPAEVLELAGAGWE